MTTMNNIKKLLAVWLMAVMAVFTCYEGDRWVHLSNTRAASQFATVQCDQFTAFNATASQVVITAANANMFIYVCSINVVVGAADNIALVEGTGGATCPTNTAGMAGGATAATGWNFAINGGIAYGSGTGAINKTKVAGDNICLLVSSAGPAAGNIAWTSANF